MSIETQTCRGDFWNQLEEALAQAGGYIPIEQLADMKLSEVVNTLAQNGIRMTYRDEWHVEALKKKGWTIESIKP